MSRLRTRERISREELPGVSLAATNRGTGRPAGQPLDGATRAVVEPGFGHDFSQVRVHSDASAAKAAESIGAVAFTQGSDVYFGAGRYQPGTPEGQRLLTHELAHVVQQRTGGTAGGADSGPGDRHEQAADQLTANVLAGRPAGPVQAGPAPALLRETATPEVDAPPQTTPETPPPQSAPAVEEKRWDLDLFGRSYQGITTPEAVVALNRAISRVRNYSEAELDGYNDWAAYRDDHWVVGGISDFLGGTEMPGNLGWIMAFSFLKIAEGALEVGNVSSAVDWILKADEMRRTAYSAFNDYLEGTSEGAAHAITGLKVTAAAGAVAATVATGGIAAAGTGTVVASFGGVAVTGGGLGLLGTSGVVAAGAAGYGMTQDFAGQSSEMVVGLRDEFDFAAIAKRGVKDAIVGFVGTLTGGALSGLFKRGFSSYLGSVSDDALLEMGKQLGLNGPVARDFLLTKGQLFVADFLAGIGSSPLITSVSVVLDRALGSGEFPSPSKFVDLVIDDLVQGGAIQLFIGGLTHAMPTSRGTIAPDSSTPVAADAPAAEVPSLESPSKSGEANETEIASFENEPTQVDIPAFDDATTQVQERPLDEGTAFDAEETGVWKRPEPEGSAVADEDVTQVRPRPEPDGSVVGDEDVTQVRQRPEPEGGAVTDDSPTLVNQKPVSEETTVVDERTVPTDDEVTQVVEEPTLISERGVELAPEGLVHYGLTEAEARASYRESLSADYSREAGIWLDTTTGEYFVVQGTESFVTNDFMADADFAGRKWKLIEHFHPGDDAIARFASKADYEHMMGLQAQQTPKGAPKQAVSTEIRWRDPVSKLEFLTEIGHDPSHAEPYWIRYRDQEGNWQTERFADDPWAAGSGYEQFLGRQYAAVGSALPSGVARPRSAGAGDPKVQAPKSPIAEQDARGLFDQYEPVMERRLDLYYRYLQLEDIIGDPARVGEFEEKSAALRRDLEIAASQEDLTGGGALADEGLSERNSPNARTAMREGNEALAAALERSGLPRPDEFHDAHHIVPQTDDGGTINEDGFSSAERCREILRDHNVNINEAANGIWLPRTSENSTTDALTRHPNIHTDAYYDFLIERLEAAVARDDVRGELKQIAELIREGQFPH